MFRNYFTEHKFQVIPRYENMVADSLENTAEKFETPTAGKRKHKVDIMNRPSILDNTRYWLVFEDDMQIKRFLELSGEFINTHIDEEDANSQNFLDADEEEAAGAGKLKDSLGGRDIVQFKSNHIPRGLIPLQSLFDQNDIAKDPKVEPTANAIKYINIGTVSNPKIIKLSKKLPTK